MNYDYPDFAEAENKFWNGVNGREVSYQSNTNSYFNSAIPGDPFSAAAVRTLDNTAPPFQQSVSLLLPELGLSDINGITHPYPYAAGFGSFAEFHTEDSNLLSANILYGGVQKIW